MNGTISPQILATAVEPVDFNSAWEGGEEGGNTANVTITEGLGAGVRPALGWIEDVGVANEETLSFRVIEPYSGSSTKSPSKFMEGAFRLVVKVNDGAGQVALPNPYQVVTPWEIFLMFKNRIRTQNTSASQSN